MFKSELGKRLHDLNRVLGSVSTLVVGTAGELALRGEVGAHTPGGALTRTVEETAVEVPSTFSPVQTSTTKTTPQVTLNTLPISVFEATDLHNVVSKHFERLENWLTNNCSKEFSGYFLPGECSNGHRVAKEIVCGKEWCPKCGEDGSLAHRRRFVRWLPNTMQMHTAGYWVFTMPEELRANYRTKETLSKLGTDLQEILKAHGIERGLRRWHWFGDKSTKWHPHLNILIDGGFISPETIRAIKIEYCALLGYAGNPNTVAHYKYRKTPGKIVHTLKYITRATFHNHEWDYEMAMELRGFRNAVVWGIGKNNNKWNMPAVWTLDELPGKTRAELEGWDIEALEKLAEGKCPVCGEAITWQKPLPHGLLDIADKVAYGCGYYLVRGPAPPGPPPDPPAKLTAEQLKAHAEEHLRLPVYRELIKQRHMDRQGELGINDYSKGY